LVDNRYGLIPGFGRPSDLSGPDDPRLRDDPDFRHARLGPPTVFKVEFSADGQHVQFTIGSPNFNPRFRAIPGGYRVRFAPIELIDSTNIQVPERAAAAFNQAVLVDSVDSAGGKELVTFLNRIFFGRDGWFWATSYDDTATESNPTMPVRAPFNQDIADSAIPDDVGDAQATITPVMVNGKTMAKVTVEAIIPNSPSFGGYQLYLGNYFQSPQLVEDAFVAFNGDITVSKGTALVGHFVLEPDVPPCYSVGSVNAVPFSAAVQANVTVPPAVWAQDWATTRRITIIGPIEDYQSEYLNTVVEGAPPSATMSAAWGGQPRATAPYAIYAPDFDGGRRDPHPVTMYFVSVSKGGTRRGDPQNAPKVTFPFGITAALSAPLAPALLFSTVQGVTASIGWQLVTDASTADNTIASFNIYRRKTGSFNVPPGAVNHQPQDLLKTIPFDKSITPGGFYSWTDRDFIIDPTSPNWDFDPTNPSVYTYWIGSVNIDGLESTGASIDGSRHDVLMLGNTGGESDPSIYRDNFWNRLWNARFKTTVAAPTALTIARNAGYAAAATVDNGQPTFGGAGGAGSNDDWTVWEYFIGGTGSIPVWNASGGAATGEAVLTAGGTGASDFSCITQLIKKPKFLNKENIVMSVFAYQQNNTGTPTGFIEFQLNLYDSAGGTEHSQIGGNIDQSILTTTAQRIFAPGIALPDRGATTYTHINVKFTSLSEANQDLVIFQPMVNGGRLGAPWTSQMNPDDVPGGTSGNPDGTAPVVIPPRCVLGSTKVLTDTGWREARFIRTGDLLRSWDGKRWSDNRVHRVTETQTRDVYTVLVVDGATPRVLYCSGNHPIRSKGTIKRWVRAGALTPGEKVYCTDGQAVFLSTVEAIERSDMSTPVPVFGFTMASKPECFVAEGFICHNKNYFPVGP
jgi:hypothetical protein